VSARALEGLQTALLVDADVARRQRAAIALAEACRVVHASSLRLAVALAGRSRPAVAVIDEALLGDVASERLRALLLAAPDIRIVTLSESNDPDAVASLAALGPVVRRPIEPGRLVAAVRRVLRIGAMASQVAWLRETGRWSLPAEAQDELEKASR
jgi:DNA-binding NarL/FixJ family response regulator